MKTIYLAGGCFWGAQHFLDQFRGVTATEVGFANGNTANPSYEDVCRRNTGHAETVRVDFDEAVLPAEALLRYYFMSIDPLSVNRQGGDAGTQYRTGIYYTDETLLPAIRAVTAETEAAVGAPLAVEVLPLKNFYRAEEYHQKYLEKNPAGYCHLPQALFRVQAEKDGEARPEKKQ